MEQPEYGSLVEYFESNGQSVYFSIHPEMYPAKVGIATCHTNSPYFACS